MALIGPSGRPLTGVTPKTAPGAALAGALIKDGSIDTFAADVLDASKQVPVIVDFWAPWCGRAKQLGPALEKVVNEAKGAVRLVKINIERTRKSRDSFVSSRFDSLRIPRRASPWMASWERCRNRSYAPFVQQLTGGAARPRPGREHSLSADEPMRRGRRRSGAGLWHVLQDEPGHPRAVGASARCYLKSGDVERGAQKR